MEELQSLIALFGEETQYNQDKNRPSEGKLLENRVARELKKLGFLVFRNDLLDSKFKTDLMVYGRADGTCIRTVAIQISLRDDDIKVEDFLNAPRLGLRSDFWRMFLHVSIPEDATRNMKRVARATAVSLCTLINEGPEKESALMVRNHVPPSGRCNLEVVPFLSRNNLAGTNPTRGKNRANDRKLRKLDFRNRALALAIKKQARQTLTREDRLKLLKSGAFADVERK